MAVCDRVSLSSVQTLSFPSYRPSCIFCDRTSVTETFSVPPSVPQEPILAPVLYTNDLPVCPAVTLSRFADNQMYHHRFASVIFQHQLDIFVYRLRKWRVAIKTEKSEAICVTHNSTWLKSDVRLVRCRLALQRHVTEALPMLSCLSHLPSAAHLESFQSPAFRSLLGPSWFNDVIRKEHRTHFLSTSFGRLPRVYIFGT